VKLITTYTDYSDALSFAIEQEGGHYEIPVDSKRLFWALPGTKLHIHITILGQDRNQSFFFT
jgi:hypothetical protein